MVLRIFNRCLQMVLAHFYPPTLTITGTEVCNGAAKHAFFVGSGVNPIPNGRIEPL